MSDSDSDVFNEILIARWTDRFIAWLIDFIIIFSICASIFAAIFGTLDVKWNEDMDVFREYKLYSSKPFVFGILDNFRVQNRTVNWKENPSFEGGKY